MQQLAAPCGAMSAVGDEMRLTADALTMDRRQLPTPAHTPACDRFARSRAQVRSPSSTPAQSTPRVPEPPLIRASLRSVCWWCCGYRCTICQFGRRSATNADARASTGLSDRNGTSVADLAVRDMRDVFVVYDPHWTRVDDGSCYPRPRRRCSMQRIAALGRPI